MSINHKKCPKCGANNSIPIIYGLLAPELALKAEQGKAKLDGCCITEGAPGFHCADCEFEWNKEQAIDRAYDQIKAIKAFVGGYFGGSYLVEFDLSCRKVSWIHWEEGKQIATYHKTIRIETVRSFINKLKSVNLLDWIFRYEQPDVCDGTHWNVEYINWRILIDMRQLIYN